MIELSGIDFRYPSGDFRLCIPSLSVQPGEKVAIIGPSGSGKTTLLNLVAGVTPLAEGAVTLDGVTLSEQSDRARRDYRIGNIGFIFQDFGLIDYLNVMDNILHPYRITSALQMSGEVKSKARWLAGQMGIENKLISYPADLSHGERQRVAICRALLTEPKIILADEATGNLDPENKLHILELLFQSVQQHNATLLAVTHDHELLNFFDRVVDFRKFVGGDHA